MTLTWADRAAMRERRITVAFDVGRWASWHACGFRRAHLRAVESRSPASRRFSPAFSAAPAALLVSDSSSAEFARLLQRDGRL